MAGSSIHDSLNALDVGLPCAVCTSVGVRDFDAKGYALATEIALSHFIAPPIDVYSTNYALSQALTYDTRLFGKKQEVFQKFFIFFKIY